MALTSISVLHFYSLTSKGPPIILVSIALEDRALLESNLSARVVPRHGAPTGIKYCWSFFFDTCFGPNAINSMKQFRRRRLPYLSYRHTIRKLDRKLVHRQVPASYRHCPFFRDVFKCQIKYLHDRCVRRKRPLGFNNLS